MNENIFIGLVHNAALLIALGLVYDTFYRRRHDSASTLYQIASGLIIGILAIVLMATPVRWEAGVIFDTRTILLGLTGLFFGAIPAAIAMTIAAAYRLYISGGGALAGVATIVSSGLIGLAWRHYRFSRSQELSLKELYLFGVAVHVTMILCMFLLPQELIWKFINTLALPVILIYPIATSQLGNLLANRNRRQLIDDKLRESEAALHIQTVQLEEELAERGRAEEMLARSLAELEVRVEERTKQLSDTNVRLADILEGTNAGTWNWNVQTGEVTLNKRWAEIIGYTLEELAPIDINTWINNVHPDDLPLANAELETLWARELNYFDVQFRQPHKDGRWVWVNARGKVVEWTEDGKPLRMSGTHLDITERKLAEEALRESEETFRSFFESAASGMAIVDLEGRALRVNPTFCRLSGYSEAEMLGMNILEVTHPDDREITLQLYDEIRLGRRQIVDYEKRYLCKDGSVIWGHATAAGVFGPDGALRYFAANVLDITESKRAQDQIRESKQMLQLVIDYIPQHVFWKDRDSGYIGCNRNFARAAGVERPQDLIGKTDYDLAWKREEADFFRECDRRVMEADSPELHIIEPQLQASGKQAWLDTNKIPLHDGEGRVVGILGTFEDITERKQAEERLKETNRELDAFVYTVSHDLRTPLTPIIGYADFLRESCRDRLDKQALDCLAEISASGEKMVVLMEDLLTLAKVGQIERPAKPVDVNQVVQGVAKELGARVLDAGLTMKWESLPALHVTKSLLAQIFDNLIGNAVLYAGREGGPIEIGGERNGKVVRFFVRDHGPGIPAEERSRIFEVFFRGTTGKMVRGTGVGLATVQKIARLYGGRAWVEETPGGGCTIWVEMEDVPTAVESENAARRP